MTGGEKMALVIASAIALGVGITVSTGAGVRTDGSQRDDARGQGDDQYKEGLGADLSLQLGTLQPSDETRWHYGGGMPGEALPTNWSRHRLAYPRRGGAMMEELTVTPMNHPAFPKRDDVWYYCPPAEQDL